MSQSTSSLRFLLVFALAFIQIDAALPFSLTLAPPTSVHKLGTEVHIEITLRNTSDHGLSIWKSPGEPPLAESEYKTDAWDSSGRPVPFTEYGQRLNNPDALKKGSRVSVTLGPGESLREEIVITRIFDIRTAGKYTIQVARNVPPSLGRGTVRSNKIVITFTH